MKELYNLLLFAVICFMVYFVFRSFHYNPMLIEGMTDGKGTTGSSGTSPANGIAGNAASYAAALKASTIKSQDTFLISKYRSDYETAILNLDDLLNNIMLKTALSVNPEDPGTSIAKLGQMQQAKAALNSVMKFIDSQ